MNKKKTETEGKKMLKGKSYWKPTKYFQAYRNDLLRSCYTEVLKWEQATPLPQIIHLLCLWCI